MKKAMIHFEERSGGIVEDLEILKEVLKDYSIDVKSKYDPHRRRNRVLWLLKNCYRLFRPYDLQIYLEHVFPEQFFFAKKNVLIPNQELANEDTCSKWKSLGLENVFCKTRIAEKLFSKMGFNTSYIGFMSRSQYEGVSCKDYNRFLHVGGTSGVKGTLRLLELWVENPQWPELIVIRQFNDEKLEKKYFKLFTAKNIRLITTRLPLEELQELRNTIAYHICLSTVEGFGHYIQESLSTGAVTFVTNAPPMNEFVDSDSSLLIDYESERPLHAGIEYFFDKQKMKEAVEDILQQESSYCEKIGANARKKFEDNCIAFKKNFKIALDEIRVS